MDFEPLAHVRAYYDALNRGDADEVAAFFTEDATHYYTRLGPHHGREIAAHAELGVEHLGAEWILEHGIDNGDEAVTEWTMVWTDPASGRRRLDRGRPFRRSSQQTRCCAAWAVHRAGPRPRTSARSRRA